MKPVWVVLSPDGIPISPATYSSRYEAKKALHRWAKGYERQGYYADSNGRKLEPSELPEFCTIHREGE